MADQSTPIRIMIVEDQHIVRSSLRLLLEKNGCTVVGEAGDAEAAVKLAPSARPHIVLMDLELPGADGIAATRRMRKAIPLAKVLFLSMHDEEKDVVEALGESGAAGYLLKSDAPDELMSAVRAVAAGKRYLSPSVAPIILRHMGDPQRSKTGEPKLAAREREVLRLVGQGRTSKEIAQQLAISPKTVQAHRDHLKEKLNLRTTAAMIQYAIRHKIIKLS